jgi:hypothetical protein
MSELTTDFYERLSKAIGDVCIYWSHIEDHVHGLILHLAMYQDDAFEKKPVYQILHGVVCQLDLRQKISAAKVLAHNVTQPTDFYERAESLLNYVDNELRPERNRYVHDLWEYQDGRIVRNSMNPRVIKPQSRMREVRLISEKEFASVDEITAFAEKLFDARDRLSLLDGELAGLIPEGRT